MCCPTTLKVFLSFREILVNIPPLSLHLDKTVKKNYLQPDDSNLVDRIQRLDIVGWCKNRNLDYENKGVSPAFQVDRESLGSYSPS